MILGRYPTVPLVTADGKIHRGRGGDRWGEADSEAHAEDNLESLDVIMLRLQAVFNLLVGQQ